MLKRNIIKFIQEECGVATADYAVLVSLLVVGVVLGIQAINEAVTTSISNSATVIPVP